MRARNSAHHRIEAEGSLDRLTVKPTIQETARTFGEQVQKVALAPQGQGRQPAALTQGPHQAWQAVAQIGWGLLGQAAQNVADFVKHGIIGRQCFGIAMGELGEFGLGALQSAAQFQITGPIDRQEVGDRPLYNAQAVAVQAHVGDHLRIEQADRVAGHRVPKAGMEFLGHRRATDYRPGLADRYLQPRPGQIPGADQAIVATADDDRVPRLSTRRHKVPITSPGPPNAA